MESSFLVGAIFEIEDRATPFLSRLGEEFTALGDKIKTLQDQMATLGRGEGLFGPLLTGIGEVGAALEGVSVKAGAMADAMTAAFQRGAASATAAAREISAAADSMAAATERMSAAGSGTGSAAGSAAGAAAGRELVPIPFDPESYERVPAITGPGREAAAERGGLPSPFFGSPRSRAEQEEEQLRLKGPEFPGWRGGGPGGPGGFGGPGFIPPRDEPFNGRPSLNYPAGGGGHMSHLVPLIEGAAVYEGMKAGAEEEQSIDITLLRGFNIDPRKATEEQKKSLRELASRAAQGTSFSEREVAGGMPVLAAPLGFTGEQGMEDFKGIYEVAAKAAEAAKQLKFGTFEGSLAGGVEFAHQMRAYKPAELQPAMDMLGKITETLPHGDMEREALVMGYVVPQARALGADPMEAMTAVGFLQQSGLQNTVAATTLRQMLIGQMKSGGPMGAHLEHHKSQLRHDMRELESSLGLKPGAMGEVGGAKKESEHVKALEDLGLTDKAGHLKDLNASGGVDINKMLSLLGAAREKMSPIEFGKALYGAFGVRGETGGAVIADAIPQFGAYQKRIGQMPGLAEQLTMIQGNAVQETGQAIARVADLGNAIGTSLLPALKAFDEALIVVANHMRGIVGEHPVGTAVATAVGVGASIYGGVMTARALPHWIAKLFSEGSAEQLTGTAQKAGPRAAGFLGGLTGPLGVVAESLFLSGDTAGGGDMGRAAAQAKGGPEWAAWQKAHPNPLSWLLAQATGSGGPQASLPGPRVGTQPEATGPQAAAAPAPVTVHLGPVTMNGVPDDSSLHALMKKLTDGIRDALSHMTSDAGGSPQSPYTYPGGT